MLGPVLLFHVLCATPASGGAAVAHPSSVAVFPLSALVGVTEPAAQLLSESLVQEVRNTHAFSQVLSPREIATIMPPDQQRFFMRCAAEACTVLDNELAGALGVSHILAGTVGRLGDTYVLNLKLLEVRTSLTLGSAQQVAQGPDESVLLRVMGKAAGDVLRDARMAPPASSSSGGALRWAGIGVAVVGLAPLLVGAGLMVTSVAWAAAAFVSVPVRGVVPSPAADRTARFLTQVWGPSAVLAAVGGVAWALAAACVAGGGAAVLAARSGGGE